MEKQIEQLLQNKTFHKTFRIHENNQSKIMDCVRKIQNVPLEKLSLRKINKESILDIFGTFKNLNLKSLYLSDCEIDPNAAMCISDFIPNLIKLGLSDGRINSDEFITLINAVKNSHSCSTLRLSRTIFDETKTAALVDCIEKSPLVNLVLSYHYRKSMIPVALVAIINSVPFSSLRTLELQGIDFDNETTASIVSCIKNSRLIKLTLGECTFVDNKILPIMKAIQQSTIHSLDVEFNFFDDYVGDIMKCVENSGITKFIFGAESNQTIYNDEEMAIIAASIRDGNLLKVGLNCMRINNDTIDSIKKSSVVSLDLYSNFFSDDKTIIENEVAGICHLLEQCQLKKLRITFEGLNDVHIRTILSSVKKYELTKFCVYDMHNLNADINQEIDETMRAQKLIATSLNKIKSARTNVMN